MSRRTFLRSSRGQVPEAEVSQRYLYSWPAELLYAHAHTLPRITSCDLFGNEQPLALEIGCGSAEFLCSLATKTPDTNFVGVDISGLALFKAIESAAAQRLENIKFINADFHHMYPLLCPASLQAVYLHFPDPNNKPRFHKRRLFNETFLERMAVALDEGGFLSVMTDVREFFFDMLQLVEQDRRFIKTHQQRYLVGFEPDVKSHFQRIWERHGEAVFRFEVQRGAQFRRKHHMTQNHHTTGQAMLNGVPFAYEISGKGHPLVFVHAGIADQRMWDEQVATFADRFQVIRYDLRGYGKTPMTAGPYSGYQDLYDLLKFLGIEKASLVGCSMGGTTIVDFALAHPEMVDALVVTCSSPSGYEPPEDENAKPDDEFLKLEQEYDTAMEQGNIRRAAELEVDYWLIGLRRTADSVDPTLRTRLYEMNELAMRNKLGIEDEQQLPDPPAVNRLGETRVPTLIIIGDLDDPRIVQGCDFMATHIPGAQKVVFSGTTHFPNMERPAEYNRVVLEFLTNLNA